jgi:hypothetical protein
MAQATILAKLGTNNEIKVMCAYLIKLLQPQDDDKCAPIKPLFGKTKKT